SGEPGRVPAAAPKVSAWAPTVGAGGVRPWAAAKSGKRAGSASKGIASHSPLALISLSRARSAAARTPPQPQVPVAQLVCVVGDAAAPAARASTTGNGRRLPGVPWAGAAPAAGAIPAPAEGATPAAGAIPAPAEGATSSNEDSTPVFAANRSTSSKVISRSVLMARPAWFGGCGGRGTGSVS